MSMGMEFFHFEWTMKNRGIDFIGLFVTNVCDRYLSVCVCVCVCEKMKNRGNGVVDFYLHICNKFLLIFRNLNLT